MRCSRSLGGSLVALGSLAACTGAGGDPEATGAPTRAVVLSVAAEDGDEVVGAELVLTGEAPVAVDRSASLALDQPVAGLLRAEGFLDEPVVLDPDQGEATVRLLRRVGPTGTERRVLHFGGDVMLGRRYQVPGARDGTPTVDSAEDAAAVVSDLAPIMAAADATMVNLESVVGDLPSTAALEAKRYLLQSPPYLVDALGALGVDVATLGNNHAYDWREVGIRSTTSILDRAGIAWTGAGASAEEAIAGRMVSVAGTPMGVVSVTTVNGDFVNDSLPGGEDQRPEDLDADDAWQYEERSFGFATTGAASYVPGADRRPGEAWQVFSALEPDLSEAEAAELWSALTAPAAYPELQDWVARRGHGGAAPLAAAAVAREVAALRTAGAALVVVQIHGGYQFSEVPSAFLRRSARAAVDAGADLVVAHHPHVLQGFEWHGDALIAYSLGNLVFDQDFLSTFPSAVLRTVFEGDELVEARVVPLTIDRYRPVPVAGAAADRVFRMMSARSALPASSTRLRPDLIGSVLDPAAATNAAVVRDGTTGLLVMASAAPGVPIVTDEEGRAMLPSCALVQRVDARSVPGDVAVGVDLLGWGSLTDATADRASEAGTHWTSGERTQARYEDDGDSYLRLTPSGGAGATARQVARSVVPEHRWFDAAGAPADSGATYTAELWVRARGAAPRLVVTLFDVEDTDPTVDPSSVELHEEAIGLPRPASDEWQRISVDLTSVIDGRYGGVRPEALLLYVTAEAGEDAVDVDDVRLLEWRPLDELPVGAWLEADVVRAGAHVSVPLLQRACG